MFERGQHLDRYRLDRKLGQGAFGEVWLATETGAGDFQRKVAIKLITAVTNPRRVADLLHEAKLCGSLSHPHVLSVDGVVQLEDAHFIVMEFVDGEDLSRLWVDLKQRRLKMPRSIVLDLGIAICEALDSAWRAVDDDGTELKIVHRDMKPHNVLVSRTGEIKVADFGIAKAAPDVTLTSTGVLKGTPTYGAPEIWMGSRDFKPAVDLYGVGVMLWEFATGERFYGRATVSGVLEVMSNRKPEEEAAAVEPEFPELAAILPSLLERSPSKRANDAGEIAARLTDAREAIGAPGGVAEFLALVRAARVQRGPGTTWDPKVRLVGPLTDWEPILGAARTGAPRIAATVEHPRRSRIGPGTGAVPDDPEAVAIEPTRARIGPWIPWLGAAAAAIVVVLLLRMKGYL